MRWRWQRSNVVVVGLLVVLVLGLCPLRSEAGGAYTRAQGPGAVPQGEVGQEYELTAAGVPADWWSAAQDHIRRSEYHVTWQDQTYLADVPAAYQAPNRVQNFRTYFLPEGPVVIARVWPAQAETPPWRWQARLESWGRQGVLAPPPQATLEAEANRIEYRRGGLVEWYDNKETGLVQGFTLAARPTGEDTGPLWLNLAIGGDLASQVIEDGAALEFLGPEGLPLLRYGTLVATDTTGMVLPVQLVAQADGLSLRVDDSRAEYPVQVAGTLTGLSEVPDWWADGGMAEAHFGYSVATAGDVNGDGYSDLIVGAPQFDMGEVGEGRAFVFHGSASGLESVETWWKDGEQEYAQYGWSVSTAGDVNRDGYSDVIIGAPYYDSPEENEGGAWLYLGSSTGLEETPDNFDQGNQANAHFGSSVATAGDVNGDYYADVIVGARHYTSDLTSEGQVWVWHGGPDGISESHNWRAESNQEFGNMGTSVGTAGDVNGDGYSDVIVGVPGYTNDEPGEGVALVWHGSPDGVNEGNPGTPDNAAWMGERNQGGARFGHAVATAGDVNGDGYTDVIVGAPYFRDGQADEGGAWVFHGSPTGLETTWDNEDQGNQEDAYFGWSVATAGDINGDGYAEVIVGAKGWNGGHTDEGRVWVWYGGSGGISNLSDWWFESNQTNAYLGASVATAGDVNGDGFSDVVVGASGHGSGLSEEGAAFVFHGSPEDLAGSPGWTKLSDQQDARFGWSVGTAGDVNGDGYADVIVGARDWDNGQQNEGGAWVYLGSMSGMQSAPDWHQESNMVGAYFGYSVATARDVNGDGYEDVIVGAPFWLYSGVQAGGALIYPGSDTGLDLTPIWRAYGARPGDEFGASVGTAGDVNGDGYADVIVGSPKRRMNFTAEGTAYVYLGTDTGAEYVVAWYGRGDQADAHYGTSVGTAGDVNRDGYSDIIVGAPGWDASGVDEGGVWVYYGSSNGPPHTADWHKASGYANSLYGNAVGTAGDVNGDGYSDIVVGARGWDRENGSVPNEGAAWVYHGSGEGLISAPAWYKRSNQENAEFGCSVGTAGDVNGDGYSDIIVGARYWSDGEPYEGAAWVYHGSSSGTHAPPDWYAQGGQAQAFFGWSVGSAGDVNGDGYADVVVGAPEYNSTYSNEGQVRVYYGNGRKGRTMLPLQMRAHNGGNVLISPLGLSHRHDYFLASLGVITSPFGKGPVRLEYEAKPLGRPFDGVGTVITGIWYQPSPGGLISAPQAIGGLVPGEAVHWRARVIYHPAWLPLQPHSRWVTSAWNGWEEADLRMAPHWRQVYLPLVLRNHEDP